VRRGGHVLGICGGYQMLGRTISDPHGVEGSVTVTEGLRLLDIETQISTEKLLVEVSGQSAGDGIPFKGYEMHVGRSTGPDCQRPVLEFTDGRVDGAASSNGRVMGCHVHGLFSDDRQRSLWMKRAGAGSATVAYENEIESTLDALGQHMGRHIDCDALLAIVRKPQLKS
jgi:adenosylcobyric acid synthase